MYLVEMYDTQEKKSTMIISNQCMVWLFIS